MHFAHSEGTFMLNNNTFPPLCRLFYIVAQAMTTWNSKNCKILETGVFCVILGNKLLILNT